MLTFVLEGLNSTACLSQLILCSLVLVCYFCFEVIRMSYYCHVLPNCTRLTEYLINFTNL